MMKTKDDINAMITIEECEKVGVLEMLAAFVDGEGTINITRMVTSVGNYSKP